MMEQLTGKTEEPRDERLVFLGKILVWLDERGVEHIPFDVYEDIGISTLEDSDSDFKTNVQGWAKELVRRAA